MNSPVVVRATGRDEPAVDLLKGRLKPGRGLALLGRYSFGTVDFTVDLLEADAVRVRATALGRNISDFLARAGRAAEDAGTGRLIRLFLTAQRGAVHACEIVEGQLLVGISLAGPEAEAADVFAQALENDRVVAESATALRGAFGQGSLNPGGWDGFRPEEEQPGDVPGTLPLLEGENAELAEMCREVLDRHALHHVAIHSGGRLIAMGDLLDDPEVIQFALNRTTGDLRRFYAEFGDRIGEQARELTRTADKVIGRPVDRFTLDVERGALFFRRLGRGEYLFTATLDQRGVARAEQQAEELARRLTTR